MLNMFQYVLVYGRISYEFSALETFSPGQEAKAKPSSSHDERERRATCVVLCVTMTTARFDDMKQLS